MFKINYVVINSEDDDFFGQNGFFQIVCNDCTYGEIYSQEIQEFLFTDALFDWLERLIRVVVNLNAHDYVVLSDVDSYNTWLEFKRDGEDLFISEREATKPNGSRDIEFELVDSKSGDWVDQKVSFKQFKKEVINTATEYLQQYRISGNYYFDQFEEHLKKALLV